MIRLHYIYIYIYIYIYWLGKELSSQGIQELNNYRGYTRIGLISMILV